MTLKLYGPYIGQAGRRHVIWYDTETKKRKTQSYARYLVEQYLGRELLPGEHVDHIDGDRTHDVISNLQVLTQAENNRKAVVEQGRSAKKHQFTCPACGEPGEVLLRSYKRNQIKLGKSGPYCSKSCAGMAGKI